MIKVSGVWIRPEAVAVLHDWLDGRCQVYTTSGVEVTLDAVAAEVSARLSDFVPMVMVHSAHCPGEHLWINANHIDVIFRHSDGPVLPVIISGSDTGFRVDMTADGLAEIVNKAMERFAHDKA